MLVTVTDVSTTCMSGSHLQSQSNIVPSVDGNYDYDYTISAVQQANMPFLVFQRCVHTKI